MSATSLAASHPRKNPSTFPPRRGKIKAKIFGDMGRSLLAAFFRAGGLLRGEGGDSSTFFPDPGSNRILKLHYVPLESDSGLFEPQLLFRAVV